MSLYCKNCGTEIEVISGQKTAVCTFCGMEQTVPTTDDSYKLEQFVKANEYRMSCRFDIAKKQYESIITQYPDDNEAYWCKILCEYGIEYVDDDVEEKRIPTCHRTVRESIFDNKDYKLIMSRATSEERAIYESEAIEIDRIQKEILSKADKEEPYDIFICYKESDEEGRRTRDSQIATKIYSNLTSKGYKVFFARVTLKELAGSKYEPIIYSALTTAKVMLVVTTSQKYVNAPWVRNEWSRFAEFAREDSSKVIVPCVSVMDAYDLPEELSEFQALDTSDMDFLENLVRQLNSKFGRVEQPQYNVIINPPPPPPQQYTETHVRPQESKSDSRIYNLINRANLALEDHDWGKASEFAEQCLDIDFRCADAYAIKLMCDYKVDVLRKIVKSDGFAENSNYKKALRFANTELKNKLENIEKEYWYNKATANISKILNDANYKIVKESLEKARGYLDADDLLANLIKKKVEQEKAENYKLALPLINSDLTVDSNYNKAMQYLIKADDYKDAAQILAGLPRRREEIKNNAIYEQACLKAKGDTVEAYNGAIKIFESIIGWGDSADRIAYYKKRIAEIKEKEEKDRKEAQQLEERCKALVKMLESAKSKQEISNITEKNKKLLNKLNIERADLEDLMDTLPDMLAEIEQLEEEIRDLDYKAAALSQEKSKLGFFAMKRKKEIDGELEDVQKQIDDLKYKKYVIEKDSYEYSSVEEVEKAIEDLNVRIAELEKSVNENDFKDADEIILELQKTSIGMKYYKEYKSKKMKSMFGGSNISVDSIVKFGKYYQQNSKKKTDIEWQVLKKEDDKILLISKYALDCKPYNTTLKEVSWVNCSLRKWLNNEFVDEAFEKSEQVSIIPTPVPKASPEHDKVFILSESEAKKYLTLNERTCDPTPYAKGKGAYTNSNTGKCWWWLRSDSNSKDAPNVCTNGDTRPNGEVNEKDATVRPSIWIEF